MDENESAASSTLRPGRIFTDDTLRLLSEIPEYKLNWRDLVRDHQIHKSQLLVAYASGELRDLGDVRQWLELTFPEDLRTAIIRYGQDRLSEEIASLNQNILELIGQLRLVTKHK